MKSISLNNFISSLLVWKWHTDWRGFIKGKQTQHPSNQQISLHHIPFTNIFQTLPGTRRKAVKEEIHQLCGTKCFLKKSPPLLWEYPKQFKMLQLFQTQGIWHMPHGRTTYRTIQYVENSTHTTQFLSCFLGHICSALVPFALFSSLWYRSTIKWIKMALIRNDKAKISFPKVRPSDVEQLWLHLWQM